jgi:hypothetical protein
MAKSRLIGNDGAIYLQEEAVEYIGDGTKTLDVLAGGTAGGGAGKGFYQVVSIATTGTVFDWEKPEVKDYFYNDGTLVLAEGDKAYPVALLNSQDEDTSIKSFEISLTKDKIDVTTMSDKIKTYRIGKADASGTLNGITTIGNDTVKQRFLDVMDVSKSGTFTMKRQSNKPLLFVGFLNSEEVEGDTLVAVVGRINIESGALGATDGSAQEYSSAFSAYSGDRLQVINIAL